MKRFIAAILLVIPSTTFAWSGKVIHIADGDTITVLRGRTPEKIRLYGIDCPEGGQAFGNKAKEYLASFIAGQVVDVESKDTDRYGRSVALVSMGGESINSIMVEGGYAWVFTKYCKERFCSDWSKMEDAARATNKGMWRDPQIIPPWEWRKEKKANQSINQMIN